MLQRIQTLYLAGVILCAILIWFFPFAEFAGSSASYLLKTDGLHQTAGETHPLSIKSIWLFLPAACGILCGIITLVIIINFKNRPKQGQLCRLNILVLTALIATLFLLFEQIKSAMGNPADALVSYKVSTFLPVLSIVLTWLAGKAIGRDEALVKAADRIR